MPCKRDSDCPRGKICRKGYTTKRGTKVKPNCIIDRGSPGRSKAKKRNIKTVTKKTKKKLNCKKGQIVRSGYERRGYFRKAHTRLVDGREIHIPATTVYRTYIKPTCIKDKGKPGRTKKATLPEVKFLLKKYGYAVRHTVSSRHSSIRQAVDKFGARVIIWHLNLLRNYTRVAQPHNYKVYTADMKYAQTLLKRRKKIFKEVKKLK